MALAIAHTWEPSGADDADSCLQTTKAVLERDDSQSPDYQSARDDAFKKCVRLTCDIKEEGDARYSGCYPAAMLGSAAEILDIPRTMTGNDVEETAELIGGAINYLCDTESNPNGESHRLKICDEFFAALKALAPEKSLSGPVNQVSGKEIDANAMRP
jgi:hypothetical protein